MPFVNSCSKVLRNRETMQRALRGVLAQKGSVTVPRISHLFSKTPTCSVLASLKNRGYSLTAVTHVVFWRFAQEGSHPKFSGLTNQQFKGTSVKIQ